MKLTTARRRLAEMEYLLQAQRLAAHRAEQAQRDPMRHDRVAFARTAGMEPDPWQARLLASSAQQIICNCSRQAGKSRFSSVLALHTALYQEHALVLLVAPALRQSMELFRTIRLAYAQLEAPVPVRDESMLRVEFANGSRIISLPGREQTIRGFSAVDLLVCDEASRCPDVLYQSIRPMLAVSDGRIVLLSTPWGRRGFFYQEWMGGGPNWERVRIPATEVPRISAAWLAEERVRLGEWMFAQEYLTEFRDNEDQVFSSESIERAFITDEAPFVFGSAA